MTENTFLILQLIVSTALMVLIWLIQILHYPSFLFYHDHDFPEAMKHHQRKISLIVIPLMIGELIVTSVLFFLNVSLLNSIILGLVGGVWISTFLLQVPLHQNLLIQKNMDHIHSLVKTNWIRTALWTIKFLLVVFSATINPLGF